MYINYPVDINELKTTVQEELKTIPDNMVEPVMQNLVCRSPWKMTEAIRQMRYLKKDEVMTTSMQYIYLPRL